jgi:hypothetical protein
MTYALPPSVLNDKTQIGRLLPLPLMHSHEGGFYRVLGNIESACEMLEVRTSQVAGGEHPPNLRTERPIW